MGENPVRASAFPLLLPQRTALTPEREALIFGSRRWTFRELLWEVNGVTARLATLGIGEGSRVATLMRNAPEFVFVAHAVQPIQAVLVPLNVRLTPTEIAWQLADVKASLLITDPANAPNAILAARDVPGLRVVVTGDEGVSGLMPLSRVLKARPGASHSQERTAFEAVWCILYTSGTTGKPKGVMLTYGNFWWSAMASALNLGIHADDVWLAVLPLFHVGGLSILVRGALYGCPVVVHESFDPGAVNQAIRTEGITSISVVSTMLGRMLDALGDQAYPPTLRCVLLGGGPAPRPLLEACAARGIPVVQTYGMTETASQLATLAPEDALRKLGSAGKALMPSELRIVDLDDTALVAPVGAGKVGQIVVRGPTVTPGYADRPDATAQAIRDGWLYTGDLGYLDEEGYLYVVSRRNDLIISGGENIYPAEIEAVLLSHPGIEEAGVFGVSDERWGQVPVAAVKVRPGATLTADDLRAYCTERLARFKIPAHFRFVDALPRNAAGKLLRHKLNNPA